MNFTKKKNPKDVKMIRDVFRIFLFLPYMHNKTKRFTSSI